MTESHLSPRWAFGTRAMRKHSFQDDSSSLLKVIKRNSRPIRYRIFNLSPFLLHQWWSLHTDNSTRKFDEIYFAAIWDERSLHFLTGWSFKLCASARCRMLSIPNLSNYPCLIKACLPWLLLVWTQIESKHRKYILIFKLLKKFKILFSGERSVRSTQETYLQQSESAFAQSGDSA